MFKGSIVAIVTPMLDSGEVDEDSYSRLLDWHLSHGTDGVVVLGTTGESATLTQTERKRLIEISIDQVRGRIPLIVGTGSNATAVTIHQTQQAKELGADAALIVTPYYNRPVQEGLYQHFKAIAEAVALPQILYNVPGRTGCDLLPETVARLGNLSNIVAIKEAVNDIERVKQLLAIECALDVLSGDDGSALQALSVGAKGVISVAANVAPKQFHEMCAAALSGDVEQAKAIDQRLRALYQALSLESNPIPVKWALMSMRMIAGGIRLPLTPLAARFQQTVKDALSKAGI
jgi:4-hydroxy-tetrahydrodipicolinate synthase